VRTRGTNRHSNPTHGREPEKDPPGPKGGGETSPEVPREILGRRRSDNALPRGAARPEATTLSFVSRLGGAP